MDFKDRHVVVTGGTGALGTGVVAALLAFGAICHVPSLAPTHLKNWPHRDHLGVKIIDEGDLADEAAAGRVFDSVPRLWASIHIAGGFAFAPLAETQVADLRGQIDMNLITCDVGGCLERDVPWVPDSRSAASGMTGKAEQ